MRIQLFDARAALEDKQEALEAAWAEIKRLRRYEPYDYGYGEEER